MMQLVMEAETAKRKEERPLPDGYRYAPFCGTPADVADWKRIIMEKPAPPDGADSCYHLMIEIYPDCVAERDIHFIENPNGERVATITTITHKDGTGYVHMVKAKESERGRGLGHAMARYALRVFEERGLSRVILTTDDYRLPAIKTYLDAGFRPVIYHDPESDMAARWEAILTGLGYSDVETIVR